MKKNIFKVIALFLAVLILASFLAACGKEADDPLVTKKRNKLVTADNTSSVVKTTADAPSTGEPVITDAPVVTDKPTVTTEPAVTTPPDGPNDPTSFVPGESEFDYTDKVIFDDEYTKITVKSIVYDKDFKNYIFNLEFVNKSDTTVQNSIPLITLCGLGFYVYCRADLNPGDSVIEDISVSVEEIEEYAIPGFYFVDLLLIRDYYDGDWYTGLPYEIISFSPTGSMRDEFTMPDYAHGNIDTVLVDDDDIKIVLCNSSIESWGSDCFAFIAVYFENKTGKLMDNGLEYYNINSWEFDIGNSVYTLPGMGSYSYIYIDDDYLKDYGFEHSVKDINMHLKGLFETELYDGDFDHADAKYYEWNYDYISDPSALWEEPSFPDYNSNQVVFDDETGKAVVYVRESDFDSIAFEVVMYFHNNTDSEYVYAMTDVEINGHGDLYMDNGVTARPHTRYYFYSNYWYSDDYPDLASPDDVEVIVFTLKVYDKNYTLVKEIPASVTFTH